jgi:acyl-coenzyme A thioesterase PaaI-like protein
VTQPADPEYDVAWLNDRSEFQMNFVHGLRNPAGLGLQYRLEGDLVVGEWTPGPEHVGFPGFVHGGLVSAVLDDAMGRFSALWHRWVVTAKLSVRYRSGARVGRPLRVEARVLRSGPRLLESAGRMTDPEGAEVATATATYLPIPGKLRAQMVEAWPGFADYLEGEGAQTGP